MQRKKKSLALLLSGWTIIQLLALPALAQQHWFEQGYAHNDYLHKRPLFDALANGYTHIEADVFLLNDSLVIAHWFPWFKEKRTLESLYLAPLKQYVEDNQSGAFGSIPPLTLVIDIKSSPVKTYLALRALLEKYKSMLSGYENGEFKQGSISIVITGHKPIGLISSEKNRLVMLDDFLDHASAVDNDNLFAMASCKYSNVVKWTGKGGMPLKEKTRLIQLVSLAHSQGKKARLWASPENENVWAELLSCGVDYINTDKLMKFESFQEYRFSRMQAQVQSGN